MILDTDMERGEQSRGAPPAFGFPVTILLWVLSQIVLMARIEKRARLMDSFRLELVTRPERYEYFTPGYRQPVPPEKIARLTREWNVLINTIDFETDDWYERGDAEAEGGWHGVGFFRIHDLLVEELGYMSSDEIRQRFMHRDREAFRRGHKSALKPMKESKREKAAKRDIRVRFLNQEDFGF